MAGEAEAIKESAALAREILPLIREVFTMIGLVPGGTIPAGTDTTILLLRIANTLDKIEENTRK